MAKKKRDRRAERGQLWGGRQLSSRRTPDEIELEFLELWIGLSRLHEQLRAQGSRRPTQPRT